MQKLKNIVLITGIAGAVVATALTGCKSWERDHGERSAGRVVDDNRITADIKESLSNEPVFKFDDVDVRTFNGVVQLSGFVNTEEQKQRAGQVAQQTAGVARVVNSIALKQETPSPTGRTTNDVSNPPSQQ